MGVLYDYFVAPSDQDAADVIDRVGGPAQRVSVSAVPARRGLFGRRGKDVDRVAEGPVYPTVADTGIDPVVQGGTLEELLTGRPYDEIERDPRSGQSLAARDGGERLVLTLTDGLVQALAEADEEQLASVAVPWAETEEFWGAGDPEALTALLNDLAGLARQARAGGTTVYCWVCV